MARDKNEKIESTIGVARFASTAWTNVKRAQAGDENDVRQAMEVLIQGYWRPVCFFIRQKGWSREDAKDLTQQFFTEFLERHIVSYADQDRGKFRSFLLACVSRFLTNSWRKRARRPTLVPLENIDVVEEAYAFGALDGMTPEKAFTRNWAKCLLESAVTRLAEECKALGKERQFSAFEARYLRNTKDYDEIARTLGITSTDVDNYLRRAKRRFRRVLREELAAKSLEPGDMEGQIQELFEALATG